jgi:hypothetical protein
MSPGYTMVKQTKIKVFVLMLKKKVFVDFFKKNNWNIQCTTFKIILFFYFSISTFW